VNIMSEATWVAVGEADELEIDDVIEAEVNGTPLAVYRTKAGYFASHGICTHEYARLCEGFVFNNVIECPKHQGRFDVRNGACKGAPVTEPLAMFPVRVVDDEIQVDMSALLVSDRGSR
jgi:3-phenylpropionate/trans-cinnamate dioxygenase ferredoxin subunit